MIATIVDSGALLKSVVAALASGIAVTLMFALALLGASRFTDATRDGRGAAAAAYATLAVAGLIGFAGIVVLGVVVMAQK